uniref:Uncharacterized protein n=1 Tax=Oryza sativa subsp. japonica TaxID=39947 RepID=Q6Z462_ORYSJ|nr:hypothetical protein [Oryza sativa Japonica Group]
MATIAYRRRISCEFERRRRRSRRPERVTIATTGRDAARRFATTADSTAAAAAAAPPSRERVRRRVVLPPASSSYRPRHATALDVKWSPWIENNEERSAAVFARSAGRPALAGAGAGDGPVKKRAVRVRVRDRVSGTSSFDVLHREKAAIRFLGSALRDCSLFVRDGSSSSSLACCVPS